MDEPKIDLSITRWGWRRLFVARLRYEDAEEWTVCIWRCLGWIKVR